MRHVKVALISDRGYTIQEVSWHVIKIHFIKKLSVVETMVRPVPNISLSVFEAAVVL